MTSLILHHYPMSPFSQKMRSMLGYANLPWQSVTTREMLPRPHLQILAGGYRKIPVGQIGADIFCDSHSIASEIARLSGLPDLALENCSPDIQKYVQHAELKVLIACLMSSANGKVLAKAKSSLSMIDMLKFAWDRIQLGKDSSVKMSPSTAKAVMAKHLDHVENLLQTNLFLFGNKPNHADFATYHPLWFAHELAEKQFDQHPKLTAWMARMKNLGEGQRSEISAQDALSIAKNHAPRTVTQSNDEALLGQLVEVSPNDYGQIPTKGLLVDSSVSTWVLSSEDVDVGKLHRHFPKVGFRLTQVLR
ncbi:MAG: glutathione S-transferase family protein [Moraxellaceae bacterium]|nr:glutathione S-transferase family protein [Moraxellaceae bacterium]